MFFELTSLDGVRVSSESDNVVLVTSLSGGDDIVSIIQLVLGN